MVPIGYRLAFDGVWHVDFGSLDGALAAARRDGRRPRALVVVNPNNPTGSFLKRDELARLGALCAREDLALISDEVFAPYPSPSRPDPDAGHHRRHRTRRRRRTRPSSAWAASPRPAACRSSSSAGSSPAGATPTRTIAALELVADTYLSVATPVQAALADLLALGARGARGDRGARGRQPRAPGGRAAGRNRDARCCPPRAAGRRSCACPPPAPTRRGPRRWSTETGVLVQPGYFFDLAGGTFLVVSLLPASELFAEAIARLVAHVDAGPEIMRPWPRPWHPPTRSRS